MAFPIGWQRVCPLVIQQSKVRAGSLKTFPVLITAACLPNEMVTTGGTNAAQANGGDIRFSSDPSGINQLACEIVSWNQNAVPANATAEIWVQMPFVSGSYDTPMYVWYKPTTTQTQPAAGAAFGSQAVWGAFKSVYHLPNGSSLSLADSTVNANTGTNHSATASAGNIDGAASFNGTTAYVDLGTSVSLQPQGPFTVSAWIKAAVSQQAFPMIVTSGDSSGLTGFNLFLSNSGSPACRAAMIVKETSSWGTVTAIGTVALNDNAWHLIVGVYTGTDIKLYVDGAIAGTGAAANTAIGYGTTPHAIIGCKQSLGANSFFNGLIDEARVQAGIASSGWLATDYLNQSSPATFVVTGTPYAPGAYA